MPGPFLTSDQVFIQGENKDLQLKVWDQNDSSTDLSSATATIGVWDKDGSVTLAAASATVSGTTQITVSRVWDTSGVSVGEYRVIAAVTFNSRVQNFQWVVQVVAKPGPQ